MRISKWVNMCLRQKQGNTGRVMERLVAAGKGHLDGDQMAHTALLAVSGPHQASPCAVSQERARSTNNQQSTIIL